MFDQLKADVARIRAVDPAARSNLEIFLLYSGLHALRSHRRANWLYRHNLPFFARAVSQLSKFTTGIEIHPGAVVGRRCMIDHGMAVVIGETAEIAAFPAEVTIIVSAVPMNELSTCSTIKGSSNAQSCFFVKSFFSLFMGCLTGIKCRNCRLNAHFPLIIAHLLAMRI